MSETSKPVRPSPRYSLTRAPSHSELGLGALKGVSAWMFGPTTVAQPEMRAKVPAAAATKPPPMAPSPTRKRRRPPLVPAPPSAGAAAGERPRAHMTVSTSDERTAIPMTTIGNFETRAWSRPSMAPATHVPTSE